MEMQPGKTPQDRSTRGFWGVIRWILLWGTIFGLSGVALVALTNKAVIWSSSNAFCGTFCHSMTWASAGYHQGPHFINGSGVGAKLRAMPYPLRLQSRGGDRVREDAAV
jgi:hypothetical protein